MKNLARGQIIGKDALFECSDKQSFQYSVIIEFADLPLISSNGGMGIGCNSLSFIQQ